MRYTDDHKDKTRKKILETASRRFRGEGIDNVGIASLMESVGLTHGGFYAHFPTKDALVEEALFGAFDDRLGAIRKVVDAAPKGQRVLTFARLYLDPHWRERENIGQGCYAASMASEVARKPAAMRRALTNRQKIAIAYVGECAKIDGFDVSEEALFALMMGSLVMARMSAGDPISDRFLEQGYAAVERLCKASAKPASRKSPRKR